MSEALYIIVGLGIGIAVGWYAGLLRGRKEGSAETMRLSGESAALNASLGEVRGQIAIKNDELASLRQAMESEQRVSTDAKARLESAREHFAEQRRQIVEMEAKVKEAFTALSATALKSNNEQFLTLAETRLKPVRDLMERYEKQIKELEEARAKAYGGLSEKLDSVQQGADLVKNAASQLTAALRSPGAKGKWGEMALENLVKMAGLSEHCDFTTQATQEDRKRPDLIVNLPDQRCLAIDSKVNTSAYLDAVDATDEEQRKRFLEKFAADVRGTLRALSAKEYWRQLSPAPEFVVMFMPGEAFFAAAVSQDRDLIVDGVEQKVIVASPTTLIALLMTVRHGWQQVAVAENAQRIADAGRELYERLCTFAGHLDDVRAGIIKSAEAFNKAAGSWSTRALPGAKKLKELGAAEAGREIVELELIETPLRVLPLPDDLGSVESRKAV